jgi:ABC-type sugar transport system ATPase subunit
VLRRKPGQLSGGQRQRVAVGRAIVRHPQVFLFDEPLSNLDAKLRVQTRREISRLHRQLGATMIYVTHDQVEAMTMGDRIVVMNAGRVEQVGAPLELYDRPRTLFVAGFIGSPAMNLLRGRLAADGGRPTFEPEGGGFALPLPPPWAQRLAGSDGRPLVLGVRPEHIGVESAGAAPTVPVQLDAVEPMGHEIILHGHAGASDLTARIAPRPLPGPGAEVRLALDPERLHFFDPETRQALPRPDEAA